MATELKIYYINFTNREDQDVEIQIQDLKDYDPLDTPNIIPIYLTGGASPLVIEAFGVGDDSIFGSGIIGKRATMSFKSTAAYGISIFSSGEDKRFYVRATYANGNKVIFHGYLVMDDNRERYVPVGDDVFISATDGLGTLDGVELTDLDGERIDPDIPLTRIQYLTYILKKTGLNWKINVVDNLFNQAMADRTVDVKNSPWNQSWVLPKTFEKDVTEYVDCKTALEILLNKMYRIYQYNGEWWVVREMEKKLFPSNSVHYTKFFSNGAVQSGTIGDDTHIITIGHKSDVNILPAGGAPVTNYFINRGSEVTMKRPCKSTVSTFMFATPIEIPRNKDFLRGDINFPLSSPAFTAYDIDDWTAGNDSGAVDASNYIRRIFENGYEKERFAVITAAAVPDNWIVCKKIYLGNKDKFSFSVDRKLSTDVSGSGQYTDVVAKIKLIGDNGLFWTLKGGVTTDPKPKWELCNAAFTTNQKFIQLQGVASDDLTEWFTKSVEAPPLPASGYILIQLYQSALFGNTRETHLSNMVFDYIPFINGSYKKYPGEKITNTNAGNLSFKPEHEINICDAQRILFKGALLKYNSGTGAITLLSDRWTDWAIQRAGPDYNNIYNDQDRLLKWASLDHYNHYRNSRRKFYVELRKLLNVFGHCDMHNLYLNSVVSEHNVNKAFVLLDMQQDWIECTMSGNMIELDDSTDKYAAAESFVSEHKYIE